MRGNGQLKIRGKDWYAFEVSKGFLPALFAVRISCQLNSLHFQPLWRKLKLLSPPTLFFAKMA